MSLRGQFMQDLVKQRDSANNDAENATIKHEGF